MLSTSEATLKEIVRQEETTSHIIRALEEQGKKITHLQRQVKELERLIDIFDSLSSQVLYLTTKQLVEGDCK